MLVPTSHGLDHAIAASARNSARLYGRSGHCASESARPRPGADLRPDKVRRLLQWIWRLLPKVRAVLQRPGVVAQAGSASAAVGARAADSGLREEEVACGAPTHAARDAVSPRPQEWTTSVALPQGQVHWSDARGAATFAACASTYARCSPGM